MSTLSRNGYRALAERRKATIQKLTRELRMEKRYINALSRLEFAKTQKPGVLKELRRVTTIRERRMA